MLLSVAITMISMRFNPDGDGTAYEKMMLALFYSAMMFISIDEMLHCFMFKQLKLGIRY